MKIVIAMDSFKGSMTADDACRIVAETLTRGAAGIEVICKPMADGGEGTARAMITARDGQWIAKTVTGPLPEMRVEAGFAWFESDKTALVEMASASGLELLASSRRNPLKTTTFGTGELILAAMERGARKILLAVGGSATNDGGVGAAMALGWRFLDENGVPTGAGGEELLRIKKIISPPNRQMPPVEVLCDVDNPLCGPHGAAAVYGPQKGATPEMVEILDKALDNLAGCIKEQLRVDVKYVPGSGAAGGLAAGAIAFMNGRLVSGIETVMAQSRLEESISGADWVITGEGRFDHQSLRGKVVHGIAKMAGKYGTKVAVIAGKAVLSPEEYRPCGITDAISCMSDDMTVEYAIENAVYLLGRAAGSFAARHLK